MKRVMIVTNALTGGGAERSMNLICNELTSRGWPVALIPINASLLDQVVLKCEVFPLNRKWKDGIKGTAAALSMFNQIVKSWQPDTIVLNCDLPELFGSLLFGKKQLVAIEHSSHPWNQRPLLGKIVRRLLKLRNVNWIVVSNHLKIWPTYDEPYGVLQNPLTQVSEIRKEENENAIKRLVYIGRLSIEKRPEIALKISQATSKGLAIIGDGILRSDLEELALKDSLNAVFLGHLVNPWLEVRPGDLLVVPSAYEGDGLIVLEGLQREVPMLLADIPDFRRFRFADRNYCSSVDEFVVRIINFNQNLQGLKIPFHISQPLLLERDLRVVGTAWESILEK
jgi:glycosyltransferase involved in cell wall biosynthesis